MWVAEVHVINYFEYLKNWSKYVYVKKKTAGDLYIKISNTAVERVYDTKFLSVYSDAQLTWKRHWLYI